jgi:hypothetical protein
MIKDSSVERNIVENVSSTVRKVLFKHFIVNKEFYYYSHLQFKKSRNIYND